MYKENRRMPVLCHHLCYNQFLKTVKATLLFLLIGCVSLSASVFSQEAKVSLKVKNKSISHVFDEIQRQTSYSFWFESEDVDMERKVSVDANQETVATVLENILQDQNVVFSLKGNHIVIVSKDVEKVRANTTVVSKVVQANPTRPLSGTIVDDAGEPIIGASVVIKGTSRGVISDIDGNFSLDVATKDVVVISYVGYARQEIVIDKQTTLAITLKENLKALEEVIVIGYTSQKKGLLTGAISSMKVTEQMTDLPHTSAGDLLVGKMPGVSVGAHSGIPGSQPSISIRTGSSFNSKQNIVFVIDGVMRGQGDFNNLSPQEIDDVVVLKDAASAAIYGAKSAGGVILVTTKRGKSGKPVFNYSYSYAVDTRTKNMALTDAVQTGSWYNKINGPDGDPAGWRWSQDELDHYKGINGGWGYDQLDEVWRNPNTQTHNFSVSGGNEAIKYFSSLSYVDQKGFLPTQDYKKMNFRLNLTVQVTKELEFFAGMALTDNNTNETPWEGAGSLYQKLLVWQPDQPVFTDSGLSADYGWIANVGAETNGMAGYKKTNFLKPQMTLNLKYKLPIEGLYAKAAFSSNWANTRKVEFKKSYEMMALRKSGTYSHIVDTSDAGIIGTRKSNTGKDYLRKESIWGYDYQLNLQLDYNRTFGDVHKVQGALVYEKKQSSGMDVYGRRQDFPAYLTDQFWATSSSSDNTDGGGGTDWKNGDISAIGQFSYSYADKYLASFSFRNDGSMKFHKDQRWGFFPAGSLGWVISEENFFNKNAVEHLKVRGSAGLTGDDSVGGWQWEESYKSGNSYYFGRTPSRYSGITYGSVVNPDLTWEKSLSYNIGVDINFLKHWNTTFDYWYKDTYDILGTRNSTVPPTFPLSMPAENYGKMRAQGFDFELGYRNKFQEVDFHANLTMSYGWNKVVEKDFKLGDKYVDIEQGKSGSYIKGYRVHSIIRSQEELESFQKQYPNYNHAGTKVGDLKPGMMVYQDLSGPDGVPDGIIDSYDRVVLFNNNNPVHYGLNLGGSWKGISLDMMFNGRLGEQKSFLSVTEGVEWNRGWREWYDNEWTEENPSGWMPKRVSANHTKTYTEGSDFWYKKNNYLRLKYVTLSYSLPKSFLGNVCDQARVFVTGTNLFVLSNFKHWDPEMGSGNNYPIMRTFNFGASISF